MFDLYGMKVYFDNGLVERKQVRFPKTKKKRIRRKWAKQAKNYKEFPLRQINRIGDSLFVHPVYFKEFCRDHDIEIKAGTDDILHLSWRGIEEHAAQLVEDRIAKAMMEPLGIFTKPEAQEPAPTTELLKELMEKVKGFQRPSQMDFLRQPLPLPEPDWSWLEPASEEPKFRFQRQDYLPQVRMPAFLLTTVF